jgi:hypothetical protein
MDSRNKAVYREWLGEEAFLDCMRRQYWFCYPAMVRIALELEFGQTYEEFSRERDKDDL